MRHELGNARSAAPSALAAAIASWALVSTAMSALLTWLLLRLNGGADQPEHVAGLFGSMLWATGALNAAFVAISLAAWRLAPSRHAPPSRAQRIAFFLSTLFALNLAWILWNHLQMAHQLASVRPFVTTTGIVEIAGIALAALLAWLAGTGIVGSRGVLHRIASLAAAIGIAAALVAIDAREAAQHRVYAHADILASAGGMREAETREPQSAQGPLILIGIDGLSWSAAVPLMQLQKLPALAQLVASGASGYLDNFDQSYSPPIWTTIFTGRAKEDHGVHGYRRLVIETSGRGAPNLRLFGNHFNIFYGIDHLLERLPSPGLWRIDVVSSHDWRAPAVWQVAGHHGRRVAVLNPPASLPLSPVNGAIANLGVSWARGAVAYQPESLATKWGKEPLADAIPDSDASFDAHAARLSQEISFAIELFREQSIDLGIFYTHFIDTVSHFNWDFYARGEILLARVPRTLSDDDWAVLIAEHQADRAFRCYEIVDRELRRLVEAFPSATFVIVSDHGWTYSGYEHFGSPDGVIIASGPRVRGAAEIRDATIDEVAPTVLAKIGVPLSRELPGKVLDGIFEEPLASTWVDSYVNALALPPAGRIDAGDDDDAERLRAIGYID